MRSLPLGEGGTLLRLRRCTVTDEVRPPLAGVIIKIRRAVPDIFIRAYGTDIIHHTPIGVYHCKAAGFALFHVKHSPKEKYISIKVYKALKKAGQMIIIIK